MPLLAASIQGHILYHDLVAESCRTEKLLTESYNSPQATGVLQFCSWKLLVVVDATVLSAARPVVNQLIGRANFPPCWLNKQQYWGNDYQNFLLHAWH